jgi:hypothetical protein
VNITIAEKLILEPICKSPFHANVPDINSAPSGKVISADVFGASAELSMRHSISASSLIWRVYDDMRNVIRRGDSAQCVMAGSSRCFVKRVCFGNSPAPPSHTRLGSKNRDNKKTQRTSIPLKRYGFFLAPPIGRQIISRAFIFPPFVVK